MVYAPDQGSVSRAFNLAILLPGSRLIFNLKNRDFDNATSIKHNQEEAAAIVQSFAKENGPEITHITGENTQIMKDAIIIMTEDEIATGGTANGTARLLKSYGAKTIYFVATHAVCTRGWQRKLFHGDPFAKVFLGNTLHRDYANRTGGRIYDLDVAPLVADQLVKIINKL